MIGCNSRGQVLCNDLDLAVESNLATCGSDKGTGYRQQVQGGASFMSHMYIGMCRWEGCGFQAV